MSDQDQKQGNNNTGAGNENSAAAVAMPNNPSKAESQISESPNTAQSVISPDNEDRPKGRPVEHGGPKGPEPTRYGDWEQNGRCTDF